MTSAVRREIFIIVSDLFISLFAFWLARYFGDLPRWYWLVLSAVIWVILGGVSRKLQFGSYKRLRYAFIGIFLLGIVSGVFLYFLYKYCVPGYEYDYSILLATGLIIVLEWGLYYSIRRLVYRKIPFFYESPSLLNVTEAGLNRESGLEVRNKNEDINRLLGVIEDNHSSKAVMLWIKEHKDSFSEDVVLLDSSNPETILTHKIKSPALIVHNCSLNEIRYLNTFLSYSNYCLDNAGYLFCHCTTSGARKERIMKQNPVGFNYIVYCGDYFLHRIVSKLNLTKTIYDRITKGKIRSLTRVEVLGRLYRAGFDVIHEDIKCGEFYVIASKIKEPIRDDRPSTGLLIRLKRVGKDGEIIGVYKFRTMHAYSEYLQQYIFKCNKLNKGGKIADDYRINSVGKFLRKTWLDELPMLINWIKGDLKLVGVRPLSNHYFSLYSKELQQLRIKTKPGLVPPFYADMPTTLEEIQESERRYLIAYMKNPVITDWKYFWKAVENIALKGERSK